MKKIFDTLVLTLAVNFLLAGLVGWLFKSGHLDRVRVKTVKELLFPPPPADAPATQPASDESAPPPASQRLAELLARHSVGRSAAEQNDFIQQTFDVTMAQLDRREREVADRERQVAVALARLTDDRKALQSERQKLSEQEKQADRLANDKGFQDTLTLYNSMASRQVKDLFVTMDVSMAADYLDAMQPRSATKILKEFKTSAELARMKEILDKMRHPPGSARSTTQETKE